MPLALIFDPYLDTLGGGERYTLTVAQFLVDTDWEVIVAWKDLSLIEKARERFNLPLQNVQVSAEYYNLLSSKADLLTRRRALKDVDLTFFVSDGSVPILFGRNRFLHYQVPFTSINRGKLLNTIKLLTIDRIVVNSRFTKKVIDRTLGTNKSIVVYPPVDTNSFKPAKKTKTILNVGRFSSPSHSKRQDVLINAFIELYKSGYKDWELVLAGGKFEQDSVLDNLQEQAKDYPVRFVVNPKFSELQELYSHATFYWHAAGFEVDESLNPEAVEHFGITTVESMSAGCVPLVANKGGQKEIVSDKEGFLWNSTSELVEMTSKLINQKNKLSRLSSNSQERSKQFSAQNFYENLKKLLI